MTKLLRGLLLSIEYILFQIKHKYIREYVVVFIAEPWMVHYYTEIRSMEWIIGYHGVYQFAYIIHPGLVYMSLCCKERIHKLNTFILTIIMSYL